MISSPGCQCLIAGASGAISTRFWIISQPGMLRSSRWRSVRVSPGTCCWTAMILLSVGAARVNRCGGLLAVRGEELGQRGDQLVRGLLGQPVAGAREYEPFHVFGGQPHRLLDHRPGTLGSANRQDRHRQRTGLALLVLGRGGTERSVELEAAVQCLG